MLLAVVLAPPPAGTEVEVGGGIGAYHYGGGCEGPHNFSHYQLLQLRARHSESSGLVLTAEAASQRGTVVRSEGGNPGEVGSHDDLYLFAARIGYEGRLGGVELGPAYGRFLADSANGALIPSVKLWLGPYGIAHAWGSIAADRTLSGRIAGFGLGHASEHVRLTIGLAGSAGNDGTYIADADVQVWNGLWLGAGYQYSGNANTWGAIARVGFSWGAATPEPRPREDQREPAPAARPVAIPLEARPADAGASDDAEEPSVTEPRN